jgi:hypothetical protein
MPSIIFKTNRNNLDIVAKGRVLPTIREASQMAVTFGLTVFAWIFFRAESVGAAFSYLSEIFSTSILSVPQVLPWTLLLLILPVFMLIEWLGRENNYALENIGFTWPKPVRWSFYVLIFMVCMGNYRLEQEFIYFQF